MMFMLFVSQYLLEPVRYLAEPSSESRTRDEIRPEVRLLQCFQMFFFFGNNEPGAVGTTRWWPPGIALQKRRFSKKMENLKGKIPALMFVRSLME